jgi:hypothetical protein
MTAPFTGARWMRLGGAVGLAGLLLTFLGLLQDRRAAASAYLVAFTYWAGVAAGALLLVCTFHAAAARWMTVLRRAMEVMAVSTPALLALFVPVVLLAGDVFPWVHPERHFTPVQLHHLQHRQAYLDVPFFTVRGVLFLACWSAVALLLLRWSVQQDETGDPGLLLKQRRLGTGAIPLIGLTLSFAGFDWLMSVDPLWQSTIFGLYYFAGSFLAAIALLALVTALARREGQYGGAVGPDHLHNLGKLLLAFTAFWAYIAFSQFMLIWIANLPEETPWYLARIRGAWRPVWLALIAGHFVLPFFLLLSRDLKLRPRPLAAMAVWQLLMHYVDLHWLVLGSVQRSPVPHWTALTAFAGVGGVAAAFALSRARGRAAIPVKDPFLTDSLRYAQP